MSGLLALAAVAACQPALLARSVEAAGGYQRLRKVRELHWQGTARVHAGGRTVDIGVDTRLAPFGRVLSRSWPLREGPGRARSLVFDDEGRGWVERDGKREPMPDGLAAHERAQYALYGLMLLAPLCSKAKVTEVSATELDVSARGAPRTTLRFDGHARLTGASNQILQPDGSTSVRQDFVFEGQAPGAAIAWPLVVRVLHYGEPYFELTITRLDVSG